MNFNKLATLLLLLSCTFVSAQNIQKPEEKLSLNSGTIDNQFEYVIKKSNNWKDAKGQSYEVIKRNWLYTLKSHTIDSLNAVKAQLNTIKQLVATQDKEIQVLKTNLENTNTTLNKTNLEKDSMSLFGIQMSKGGYNALLWAIIGGLLAFLLFFIYKFKNSNSVTKQAKLSLTETEEEFEQHRKKALEREQKVMRRLQDELNKQKANS